jgi:hypothetical protein
MNNAATPRRNANEMTNAELLAEFAAKAPTAAEVAAEDAKIAGAARRS